MSDHLIVIRSAATDYDLQGRVRGSLDLPLAAAGLREAAGFAARVAAAAPAAIYAGPSACARETARLVGERCGLVPKRLDLLANLDLGLWEGKLVSEIRRLQPRLHRQWQEDPWSIAPPEGELLEEAVGRVERALDRVCRRHPAGRIAVVVPAPLDALVRWLVGGAPLGDLWQPDPSCDPVTDLPLAAQWQASPRPPRLPQPPVISQA